MGRNESSRGWTRGDRRPGSARSVWGGGGCSWRYEIRLVDGAVVGSELGIECRVAHGRQIVAGEGGQIGGMKRLATGRAKSAVVGHSSTAGSAFGHSTLPAKLHGDDSRERAQTTTRGA